MTHETTWRIAAAAAISLALLSSAALAITLVVAFERSMRRSIGRRRTTRPR
ncbi:hypothetical protein [Arthrobacter sp. MMS18-M83]|uniref:hypothetical protein n=1 Tax=Arthrobacter sp. MMS18-M83 TaxID=2996261 RepID=UPI00227BF071|nr:hypothetical protein [Arthrobacter sp. MMS18-M83]WAH97790.1 hypothetical protein OW521_02505 [Arthrobacter sp. MMS18-M83]